MALLLTLGCGSGESGPDGSMDGSFGSGSLTLTFSVDEPERVERAVLGLRELRVRNDRGGDFEPQLEGVGSIDLLQPDAAAIRSPAPPATYGRVTWEAAPNGWGPALSLRFSQGAVVVDLVSEAEQSVDLRCEGPVELEPGGDLQLELSLELHDLEERLEGRLPAAGEVTIDSASNRELLTEVEDAFREAWHLGCGAAPGEPHE